MHKPKKTTRSTANYPDRIDPLSAGIDAHKAGRLQEAAGLYARAFSTAPDDVRVLHLYGLLLAQLKQYDQAGQLLKKALALDPGLTAASVDLTWALMEQGKLPEAIGYCEAALRTAPDNLQVIHNLAGCLHKTGRHADVIALLEPVVAANPGFSRGLFFLGCSFEQLARLPEAIDCYRRAAEADPKDDVSLGSAGDCLMKSGRAAEALVSLDRALMLRPAFCYALGMKTLALAELGRTEEERWLSDPCRLAHTHRLTDWGVSTGEMTELNRQLSLFASNHPTLRADPPGNATYQGLHSKLLQDEDHPAVFRLKQLIAHALQQRIRGLPGEDSSHPFVRSLPSAFKLELWAVKMTAGGKMLPHIHPSAWLSGVYYVDVPGVVNDPLAGEAGWLKLGPPRNDIPLTRQTITRTIKPEPGLMVTFPSYLWHDTVPLPPDNTEQRLSLAFDVRPR